MRRIVLLVPVLVALTACGSEEETAAGETSSTATTTSSAPATTTVAAAEQDRSALSNCLVVALAYGGLQSAIASGGDVAQVLQLLSYGDSPDIETAGTDAGAEVNVALAELNYQVSLQTIPAVTGTSEVDVAALAAALEAADEACETIGGSVI